MIEDVQNQKEAFSWLTLAPSFLIIISWWVVARQNDLRERRKDIRELIKSLDSKLGDIHSSWLKYSSLDGDEPESLVLAAKIRADVSSISPLVQRINMAGLKISLNEEIALFRQKATGGDFDSKDRKSTDFSEDRNSFISLTAMEIIRSLEEKYFQTYPLSLNASAVFLFVNWELVFSAWRKWNKK